MAAVKSVEITPSNLNEILDRSQFKESTKDAVRAVLLEKVSYHKAGEPYGLSRQFVYRRTREVLERAGLLSDGA